jgi:hypothetical protein
MFQNTDHIVEGRTEDKQAGKAKGGGIRLEAHAYKVPVVIEPRKDGPIAQPA